MFFSQSKKIVTHSGSFHADDIFACATLSSYLDQKKVNYRIIRTRDQKKIEAADYVIDVGGDYDPECEHFDHHQTGGAGERENTIPYASFGLVWKKYGPLLCHNNDIVEDIDRRLVQPIDAIDNGISISESNEHGLYDYGIYGIISAFQATWKEADSHKKQDQCFIELVDFFKNVLQREIIQSKHRMQMVDIIRDAYESSQRKDIIEIPYHVSIGPLMQVLGDHKEVKYIVARSNNHWKALSLRTEISSFESRISFPQSWGGKRYQELQTCSGVPDAIFCHNALFLAVAESREGARLLAERSLEEANK